MGTYEFAFDFAPPEHPELRACGRHNDGTCDLKRQEITISAALDDRKTLEIVWHEITHAMNWVCGISSRTAEETIARKHGEAWSQFFLDNPKFVRWYTSLVSRIRKERK